MKLCERLQEIIGMYKNSEKKAIIYDEESMTYGELYYKAYSMAKMINQKKKNERVALFLPDGCDYLTAYFAILLADCSVFPIKVISKVYELEKNYQLCGFSVLITKEAFLKELPESYLSNKELQILTVETINVDENDISYMQSVEYRNEVAVLLNTSGTTSSPKIVRLSHTNLLATMDAYFDLDKLEEDAILLLKVPFSSSYGNFIILSSLFCHATMICKTNLISQRSFLEIIDKYRVTHFECIAPFLKVITNKDIGSDYDISSLAHIAFGGDAVGKVLIGLIMQKYPNVTIGQAYGMSEASPLIAIMDPKLSIEDKAKFQEKMLSVGKAAKGVQLKIDGNESEGELLVKGPNVMLGYLNNQEETDRVLQGGYLHTGDIAYIDEEGYVFLKGRKKNCIIVNGFNVYPEEVEEVLCKYSGVKGALVYGCIDQNQNVQIGCKIETKEKFEGKEKEIQDFCCNYLTNYKIPKKIIFVEALERNNTGKVIRK